MPFSWFALAWLSGSAARAADAAWYHPDDVAAHSKVFAAAAKSSAPAFDTAQDRVGRLGRALEDLELGSAILGDRAPEGLLAWTTETRRTVMGGFLEVQRHVDLLQDDYSREFGAALQRALAVEGKGRAVVECGATGVQALIQKKTCAGDELNSALAARIDADSALSDAIDEINGVQWPIVQAEPRTWAPVPLTGAARWVDAAALARRFAPDRVQRRTDDLDRGLADLEEAIQQGDAAALARAKDLRAAYEVGLGQDGEVLRAAVTEALQRAAKKGGPTEVGLCANPTDLGGCTGDNATAEVIDALATDRKLEKALAALR